MPLISIHYPVIEGQVGPFYDNAYDQLEASLAAKYGINAAAMAKLLTNKDTIPLKIKGAIVAKIASQGATEDKRAFLSIARKDMMRVFRIIADSEIYEEVDGEKLGFRVEHILPDLNTVKPDIFEITVLSDQVIIDWVKSFLHGIVIDGSYDGINWTRLDKDLKSPFEDRRKNQQAGVPETRYYRFRYLYNDVEVGLVSEIFKVICEIY